MTTTRHLANPELAHLNSLDQLLALAEVDQSVAERKRHLFAYALELREGVGRLLP